jgi:hypothetical protein
MCPPCRTPEIDFMIRFLSGLRSPAPGWAAALVFLAFLHSSDHALARSPASQTTHAYFIDCSAAGAGDGSREHPWNTLTAAEAHPFEPDDRIALARGTSCPGSFAPQGSGMEQHIIRLTAYGHGPRPQIVAPASARQILLLSNQEYWQIDSLDLAGAGTYGIFVTGDKGPLRHIYLKNLSVHDVYGGAMKNKDNGLVVVGPSGPATIFNDVLIDGVDAAHTTQWSGILIGGGDFPWPPNAPLNRNAVIRNSTAHDVYGDGIILFRDADSAIRSSAAWETGMQPTESVGTPNAIWTWTCTDCTVEDNEAYVTDSPGVDGGAYDIDWDNSRNTVERNYAHDTQGYCVAIFAASYVTSESVVRDNLCIDNGLSPRLAALQGAVYLHSWNGGVIRGLQFEHNTIEWNPRVPDAPAIVSDVAFDGPPAIFAENHIVSTSPLAYRIDSPWASSKNIYSFPGEPVFDAGSSHNVSLATLQSQGFETESSLQKPKPPATAAAPLHLEATIDLVLDEDGLLAAEPRAQLVALRSVAGQYGPGRLTVTIYVQGADASEARSNAIRDLDAVYPGALHFEAHPTTDVSARDTIRLLSARGDLIEEWHGFQNAATLGGAVRGKLGPPEYSHMQHVTTEGRR